LIIASTNIRSYRYKTNIIHDFLSEFDIDILCLCETKLSEGFVPLNVPGYSIICSDRDENGGGVAILFKSSIQYQLLPIPEDTVSQDSKLEIICAKFQCDKYKSVVVSSVYRPKFNLSFVDVKSLEHVFNFLGSHNLDFYACGDFNIHMENNTKAEIVRFNRLLSRLSLKEHINMPTRGNAHLDLIISNDLRNLHSQTELLARTDHLGVFIVRPLKKCRRPKLTLTYRNYRTVDWQKFANDVVNKIQWNDESSMDTDTIVTKLASDFINNHTQLFDIHAPLTETSFRQI
jgi:hypothetical protein